MHHSRVRELPDRQVIGGIALVALARALDYLTTWISQQPASVGEGNPLMAQLFASVGQVPALATMFVVTVGTLAVGVELTIWLANHAGIGNWYAPTARVLAYGTAVLSSAIMVANNMAIILT